VTPSHPKIPRRRWRIAFLVGIGVLVNYFDRVNLSVAHAALITSFAISNITFGYLSAAYNWTYTLCQLPVGVLLDRFGVRRVGRISSFIWSVASFAAAITPNLGGFFAARLLLGIGEAPTFPSNAKAIGYWFPARERSSATSIFDGAAKFASAIGVPMIGILLLKVGWRWCFAATGMVSFLYFLLFCRVYRDPSEDPKLTTEERDYILEKDAAALLPATETASLGYLIRQPKVIGVALGFGAYNYVFYLLLTWLPSYLSSALHIDLLHSFLYTGVPWLVGTASELVVGGWLGRPAAGAGMECQWRAAHGTDRRNDDGAGHHWRRLRPNSCHRAVMDQHLAGRSLGRLSRRLVCAIPDRSPGQCRHPGRHPEFLQPGLRYFGAHRHRLPGHCPALLWLGIWRGRHIPVDRDLGLHLLAWPPGKDSRRASR
jgi:MFS family permease